MTLIIPIPGLRTGPGWIVRQLKKSKEPLSQAKKLNLISGYWPTGSKILILRSFVFFPEKIKSTWQAKRT